MGSEELRVGVILNPFCLCLPKEPMLVFLKIKEIYDIECDSPKSPIS